MSKQNSHKSERAIREEEILAYWKEKDIFNKTLEKESPEGEFVFYEGPPTANGRPGIHHMESRAFKDIIPRYKTMRGYHVRRKAGWDTHGLPVELEVEKELGFGSKKDIEKYGIEKFNEKCKENVWKYVDEWEQFTNRIAFWVDTADAYITYKPDYIESLWSIVKHIHERDLLYKDYKVVPWCTRCGTALSSHELAQGYESIVDTSVSVKFKIKNPSKHDLPEESYFLAWTTTPWTLPGNVALAIGGKITYVLQEDNLIVAKDCLEKISDISHVVKQDFKGTQLVSIEYEPLYAYLEDSLPSDQGARLENTYKTYLADFVTTDEGTGIVHTAVMYGADDFELGTRVDLPKHHLLDERGVFISETDFLAGKYIHDVNEEIIEELEKRGLVGGVSEFEHSYPHCWRCKTKLIYFARDSWYIKMSELRDEMVVANEGIHWEPSHIKKGRFGEWLREAKDWAVSRERYWGTPLPIWMSENGEEKLVVGSIQTLKEYTKTSGNEYHIVRHGEAELNVKNTVNSDPKIHNPLTKRGKDRAREVGEELKETGIDLIFHSPLPRTSETAKIIADEMGLDRTALRAEDRLSEIGFGEFEGKAIEEYHSYFEYTHERMTKVPKGGESWGDVKKRMAEFLYEIEEKYQDKKILFVSHNGPLMMLQASVAGSDNSACTKCLDDMEYEMDTGERRDIKFVPIPHNKEYELDLHRPYIDEVRLVSKSGKELTRVKEVMDVWFDSGGMPFAQDHYPMENKEWIESRGGYPADYIAEAIDQTRGWFYTLHAIGVLLDRGKAFRNVISLGHLLDSKGKKMSKSVGNVIDPGSVIDKYGVDVLRMWMFSVNQPGDSKNFDERTIEELVKKLFNLFENVTRFYEMYAQEDVRENFVSDNVLDRWIIAKLNQLIEFTTVNLDEYRVLEPARAIRDFIGEMSTWYIRRSRSRFKSDNAKDREAALSTTKHVLIELSKLMAPFTPFAADDVYRRAGGEEESVHLAEWPIIAKGQNKESELISEMEEVRRVVSQGLEARANASIKVRQPLSELKIKSGSLKNKKEEIVALIREEMNVKKVSFDLNLPEDVVLDTALTQELAEEGVVRELTRSVQDLRKDANLTQHDEALLVVETTDVGKEFIKRHMVGLKKQLRLSEIKFGANNGKNFSANKLTMRLSLKR